MPHPCFRSIILITVCSLSATALAQEPSPTNSLHTDEQIRQLAKHEIAEVEQIGGRPRRAGIFSIPCLDVVPSGETAPRAKVFKKLGLEESRLQDFRHWPEDKIEFLLWQVSPSYDICCMTYYIPRGEDRTDPERIVYGIRLLKRPQR